MDWTDIDEIAEALNEANPDVDPESVRFTALRDLVEDLEDFEPEPGMRVNEQILEAIQAAWIEEREDAESLEQRVSVDALADDDDELLDDSDDDDDEEGVEGDDDVELGADDEDEDDSDDDDDSDDEEGRFTPHNPFR